MAERKYYWLKLHDDFFSSKRIKKLRKLAGGDTYTIIYLKIQLMAMQNDGIIKWTGLEDDFASELALDLDESPENVAVTLQFLLSCGLAETEDSVSFFFPWALENTGSEGSSAKRMREMRARQALEPASQCDAPVTPALRDRYTEKEIEREKEKELEKEVVPPAARTATAIAEEAMVSWSEDLRQAVMDWLAYKKEKRQPYKEVGLKTLLSQIRKAADQYGEAPTIDVIRNSMASGYQGITLDRLSSPAYKPTGNRVVASNNNTQPVTREQLDRIREKFELPPLSDAEWEEKVASR